MRIGISLPQHGSAATPEGLIAIAKRAEALGYHSLWVGDRLLAPVQPTSPYPVGDGKHPLAFRSFIEPLSALTLVAGHTERVKLGTSVLILPIYHPVVLARHLMTLDVLCKGRLLVGLGVGWNLDELEAIGMPAAERGKRADEAIELMQAIWTKDPVEFHARYYQVPLSWMGPKPVQKPHPPIYLASFSPIAARRVAKYADGWNPTGIPIDLIPKAFEQIASLAGEAGRDASKLQIVLRANLVLSDEPLGADRPEFHGTLEQIGEDVAKARRVGIHELFFDLWTSHPKVDKVDDWLQYAEKLWAIAQV